LASHFLIFFSHATPLKDGDQKDVRRFLSAHFRGNFYGWNGRSVFVRKDASNVEEISRMLQENIGGVKKFAPVIELGDEHIGFHAGLRKFFETPPVVCAAGAKKGTKSVRGKRHVLGRIRQVEGNLIRVRFAGGREGDCA
jgi:hypothetical protein